MRNITYIATAPSTSAFVTTKGDGEARVVMLVPESEKAAMAELGVYGTGKLLRVTVEVLD